MLAQRSGFTADSNQCQSWWLGLVKSMHGSFDGHDVSTEDASWTNQSKRDVSNQMKKIGSHHLPILRGFACARALNTGRHHRTLHVVPSTAASTAQQTRAPASAQAARKLRLFKHSEIAARAVDAVSYTHLTLPTILRV